MSRFLLIPRILSSSVCTLVILFFLSFPVFNCQKRVDDGGVQTPDLPRLYSRIIPQDHGALLLGLFLISNEKAVFLTPCRMDKKTEIKSKANSLFFCYSNCPQFSHHGEFTHKKPQIILVVFSRIGHLINIVNYLCED